VIAELGAGAILIGTAGVVVGLAGIVVAVTANRRQRELRQQLRQLEDVAGALAGEALPAGVVARAQELDPDRLTPLTDMAWPGVAVERRLRIVDAILRAGRRRANLLERAVRAVPEGLVLTDASGEVVFRNDVAQEYATGRHGDALVSAAVRELVGEAVGEGHRGSRTLDLFGPPRRTIVVSARPLVDSGRSVGALAIIADLTEKRRLEAVRRDFVANISHELKTPVGALSLLAETLMAEDDTEITHRLAERMVGEATRLANTIEDLLVLSRIESAEHPDYEPVAVSGVVAEAVDRILPAAENAGIAIDAIEPDPHLTVAGDRRQLVSALYNLLDNAVKYSDPDSKIDVRVTDDQERLQIAVQDHGIGIPANDIERVFERFYRVDLARSRQTGGTGLGLSIVRHVMANHGGEVTVASRLGEGSTFTLDLPLAAAGVSDGNGDER
jgi:two-component system sensor histidine kinase SenX3